MPHERHRATAATIPVTAYCDTFGNWCSRIVAPKGEIVLTANAIFNDNGQPDAVDRKAQQHPAQDLPFDPRNNKPFIGRILIARGRDAADVSISNSFGPSTLKSFKVWTDEVTGQ